ncbi:MAG: YARHG domain-containing protein [Eubacteriaceae bacterium]|nr:YARHG domain-containing protein [Eubacteriaceae bacterium]
MSRYTDVTGPLLPPSKPENKQSQQQKSQNNMWKIIVVIAAFAVLAALTVFIYMRVVIPDQQMNLGQEALSNHDYQKAVDHFNQVIAVDGGNVIAYQKMGEAYLADKKYAEAIKTYEKALNLAKDKSDKVYIYKKMIKAYTGDKKSDVQMKNLYAKAYEETNDDAFKSYKPAKSTQKSAASSTKQKTTVKSSSSGKNSTSVIPDSSSRYLTNADLSGMNNKELCYARNEILARHGRRFQSTELQTYFNGKSWYNGTVAPDDFSFSVLNDYEMKNVDFLLEKEKKLGEYELDQ